MSEINRNMRKMFTEKQIEEIAKSSVSGGTKLYKHVIEHANESSEIEGEVSFTVISTISKPIETNTELNDLIDSALNIIKTAYGHIILSRYTVIYSTTIWDDCSFTVLPETKDTVTPL